MVQEGRGLVGKGDGGVRGILREFNCHAGLIAVKMDVVDGGASLKVLGGGGGDEDIFLLYGASRGGAYELVELGGRHLRGLFNWLGLVVLMLR